MNQKITTPALPTVFFVLFAAVLLVGWLFYLPYKVVHQSTISSLNDQQALLARQAAQGIEQFFNTQERLLGYLINHPDIIDFNGRQSEKLLEEFFQANEGVIRAVSRLDRDGFILHSVPPSPAVIGRNVAHQPHNRLLMANHEPVLSTVFTAVQGYDAVSYVLPVFAADEYVGGLAVLIPFKVVAERYLADIALGKSGYAWMIDQEGVEIYCPIPDHVGRSVHETSGLSPSMISTANAMMAGTGGQTIYVSGPAKVSSGPTFLQHVVYHPVELPHNRWSVAVAASEQEALAAVRSFGRWWSGIFLFIVVLLIGATSWFVRHRLRLQEQQQREVAEGKLLESQQLFVEFINAAHVPLAMVNVQGSIEFLNEKCVELYGYTLEDIPTVDEWFARAFPDTGVRHRVFTNWQNRLVEAPRHPVPASTEERAIVCRDGSIKDVEFAYTRIKDRLIITLNDKTAQNKIRQESKELSRRKAKARKMEALGLLVGGVAHDLNNILSGVVSYPELLLMQLPEDHELREAVSLIQQSGSQAAAMVADLLTVARGVASVKETADLTRIVNDHLRSPEFLALAAHHPHIDWVQEPAVEPATLSCSVVHVRKSLMNLLLNAAEAIDGPGRITIAIRQEALTTAQVAQRAIAAGNYVVLSVGDSGTGIGDDDLEHIFEPFYTKKQMGRSGTGLGLAVVWNTMEDHGGCVTVTSDGQGTLFELFFPASDAELTSPAQEEDIALLRGQGEKILVVDDLVSQRDIACKCLEHLHYECHAVASGEEAVAYLAEHEADLVILDMLMEPGMNGCQTYAALLEMKPGQKAIIASGFSEGEAVKEAQRLGAGELIKKPYSMARLGLAVRAALAAEKTGVEKEKG